MVFYRVQVRSSTELLSTPRSDPKINLMELERNIKIDMTLSEIPGKIEDFFELLNEGMMVLV